MSEEPPVAVTPEDVHAHPRKTGHSRLDLIIALTAILMSAISLYVAIEHGETQRKLVAASSWPFLEAGLYSGDDKVVLSVDNGGVGPAKLETFEVSYGSTPLSSGLDWLRRCCGLPGKLSEAATMLQNGSMSYNVSDGVVLRPGDSVSVLTLAKQGTDPALFKRAGTALLKLKFKACYCSILDECWVSDLLSTHTQRVKSCPAPAHKFDGGGR